MNVLIGILSEDQAGKGLCLKDLEKLSKMVRTLGVAMFGRDGVLLPLFLSAR